MGCIQIWVHPFFIKNPGRFYDLNLPELNINPDNDTRRVSDESS